MSRKTTPVKPPSNSMVRAAARAMGTGMATPTAGSGDPWERARRLAARAECDATAIWEWGVVERVSTGLLCTAVDLQPVGRQMQHAADVVSGR